MKPIKNMLVSNGFVPVIPQILIMHPQSDVVACWAIVPALFDTLGGNWEKLNH